MKQLEYGVGCFVLGALLSVGWLLFTLTGMQWGGRTYTVYATFSNVGDIKKHALVSLAGVPVGEVQAIALNPKDYQAKLILKLRSDLKLPKDSSANIYTQGLLGNQYIALSPGFSEEFIQEGEAITHTQGAMILESIIGQLMYSLSNNKEST